MPKDSACVTGCNTAMHQGTVGDYDKYKAAKKKVPRPLEISLVGRDILESHVRRMLSTVPIPANHGEN